MWCKWNDLIWYEYTKTDTLNFFLLEKDYIKIAVCQPMQSVNHTDDLLSGFVSPASSYEPCNILYPLQNPPQPSSVYPVRSLWLTACPLIQSQVSHLTSSQHLTQEPERHIHSRKSIPLLFLFKAPPYPFPPLTLLVLDLSQCIWCFFFGVTTVS